MKKRNRGKLIKTEFWSCFDEDGGYRGPVIWLSQPTNIKCKLVFASFPSDIVDPVLDDNGAALKEVLEEFPCMRKYLSYPSFELEFDTLLACAIKYEKFSSAAILIKYGAKLDAVGLHGRSARDKLYELIDKKMKSSSEPKNI